MSHDLTVRFICDRCGFECSNLLENDTIQPLNEWSHTFVADVRKDLCPECVAHFRKWFDKPGDQAEAIIDVVEKIHTAARDEREKVIIYLQKRAEVFCQPEPRLALIGAVDDIASGRHDR